MMKFTVEHKFCGMTKTVEGFNVWDALKSNGLDPTIWIVKNVEKIWKKLLTNRQECDIIKTMKGARPQERKR